MPPPTKCVCRRFPSITSANNVVMLHSVALCSASVINGSAQSCRPGPRARRLPDQLAWEALPGSARDGGEQLQSFWKEMLFDPDKTGIDALHHNISQSIVCRDLIFPYI